MATFALVFAALLVFQALNSNRRGSESLVENALSTVSSARWHFVALQYSYRILNRTYVVFVTDNMLCGARVRGALPAPMHVTERWKNPLFYPRPSLASKYQGINVESSEFLARSHANFQWRREEIDSIVYSSEPKWGMGTVPYSGRLFITLTGGTRKELILLGQQEGPTLRDRLLAAGFGRAAA